MSVAATMPQTILEVFDATVKAHADRPAMLRKRGDAWEPISWSGYQALVARAARALVAHGVGPGSGIVVLSANRPEWFVTNLAGMTVGAREGWSGVETDMSEIEAGSDGTPKNPGS